MKKAQSGVKLISANKVRNKKVGRYADLGSKYLSRDSSTSARQTESVKKGLEIHDASCLKGKREWMTDTL